MKEEKSFAGFVRKKCVTKRTKLFFLLLSLTVGNMPTGGAAQPLLLFFYPWLAPLDGKRPSRVSVSLSVGDADSCLRRKDASRRHDASEWGAVVKKKTLDDFSDYR